jgi:hypothetical protein
MSRSSLAAVATLFFALIVLPCAAAATELVVTSTADRGQGTLRWALQTARSGDVITFDPEVFPPDYPTTIYPTTELPALSQHQTHITIDASNAGVIIDGTRVPGEWTTGLSVCTSDCTVMGLQVVNFSGSGIAGCTGSRNQFGGDPEVGTGPTGQGNLVAGNGIGIDLCSGGSDNVITGNIIGTDVSRTASWGNTVFGISIEDGVTSTTIGPDNVFANNRIGIDIAGPQAIGNTVTRNAFLKSSSSVLNLRDGGNADLAAPFIESVDSQVGVVAGTACPDCILEVYTFDANGWSVFEGTARADTSGRFSFQKGEALSGPTAIALATNPAGSTGPSSSSSGTAARIQEAASSVPSRLVVLPSAELADNRIGVHFINLWHLEPEAFPGFVLDASHLLGMGAKRVRFSINDLDYFKVDWSKPEFSIDPAHDAFITALADAGVGMTFVLSFWDTERAAQGWTVPSPRFKTEDEIQRYLEFVRFMVGHFKDRIERYEIWNEPSLPSKSIQSIEVGDYLRLVERVAPVIRDVFPEAKIVVGGTHSLIDEDSQQYLYKILRSNAMPLVDVVSWHPMYGSSPEYVISWLPTYGPSPGRTWHRDYYYGYPAIVRDIQDVASAHGFRGEFVADEIHWNTPDIPEPPWPTYSETTSAKYYTRVTLMNLGLDVSVTQLLLPDKPTLLNALRNLNTSMAGNESIDMPVEIDIEIEGPVAYCAFRYPNGDRMLAVWTDGIAQDEDPGVPAMITFSNLLAGEVTGIDVLHGFEQELVFEIDSGNTIIRDLLVKDYPLLILLSDVTMGPDYEETVGDGYHQLGDINAVPSNPGGGADRDGDGVPDEDDFCPDWPGSPETSGC